MMALAISQNIPQKRHRNNDNLSGYVFFASGSRHRAFGKVPGIRD